MILIVLPNLLLGFLGMLLNATDKVDMEFDAWFGLVTGAVWIHVIGGILYCFQRKKATSVMELVAVYFILETLVLWVYNRCSKATYIQRGRALYGLHSSALLVDMVLLIGSQLMDVTKI